jgi:hypothetical protein
MDRLPMIEVTGGSSAGVETTRLAD